MAPKMQRLCPRAILRTPLQRLSASARCLSGKVLNAPTSSAGERFPPGFNNAFWFAVFNAFSFQIILSSPMVLYAKALNASATSVGILVGMMPLLVIFQIPAAAYVSRVGYKRFVYNGWGTRVAFIFAMA